MLTSPEHRHVATGALAILAQRLGPRSCRRSRRPRQRGERRRCELLDARAHHPARGDRADLVAVHLRAGAFVCVLHTTPTGPIV